MLLLSCGVPLEIVGSTTTGRLRLRAGEATCFAVQHRSSWEAPAPPWTQEAIARVWTRPPSAGAAGGAAPEL